MPGASRSVIVNAPIEKCFDVITDYETYADFAPETREVRVHDRQGNELLIDYKIEVVKLISYTLRFKEERPTRVSWSFVGGEIMKDNKGFWLLEPLGEGATRVTYTIELSLGPLVPRAIVNKLAEQGLPRMLQGYKRKVEGR